MSKRVLRSGIREMKNSVSPVAFGSFGPLPKNSLRKQGVDGHTLLKYNDDIDLFKSLDITILKQEIVFIHPRRKLDPADNATLSLPALAPTPVAPV
ncbi:hypothetical protein F5Y16DRAFT_404859 [Xylariaceae sp. FL0255]|nr:hypothetical protein F5Y16DRAFT_404859 [Xylariaceae sp. FL0255]